MSIAYLRRKGITGTSGTIQRDFRMIEANLNKELAKLGIKANKGLLLAAIEIRRDMDTTPPMIPVDLGNLRASSFIVTKKNAHPSVVSMQIRGGQFVNGTPADVLIKLQQGHPIAIAEAQNELGQFPIGVALGFSAYYAAPVHEMVQSYKTGSPVNWSRPGSGAKFFQAALYRNFNKIVSIVAANCKIP